MDQMGEHRPPEAGGPRARSSRRQGPREARAGRRAVPARKFDRRPGRRSQGRSKLRFARGVPPGVERELANESLSAWVAKANEDAGVRLKWDLRLEHKRHEGP